MLWTFLYDGDFILRRMNLPAHVGINEMAPIATTLQRKPLNGVVNTEVRFELGGGDTYTVMINDRS